MPKPRSPRLVATVLAAAISLAACGSDAPETDTSSGVLDDVTVSEAADDETTPEVTFEPGSVAVEETESRVVTEGDGSELTGSELISFDFAIFSGETAEELSSSYPQTPVGLDLADENVLPGLTASITGQNVGSRLLVALPPAEAFGEQGNPQLGIEAGDTVLFLVDILAAVTPLDEATGAAVEPVDGLPTVEVTPGEPATITIPEDFKDPDETVVQPLITGEGPEVTAGQTVRVAYTGVTARDGNVFDSSANAATGYAEFPIGVGSVIQGWDTGLVGQTVGSRVLLVIPAEEGYGEQGSPPDIQGGDTLVFVVDILAAY
ncbi:peptidylprolyl isomerase [Nostocoides sp. F2B08]|uniref:FKBP-type peptidyl-prolyl cis-trans isomerase n=1 Tax=Nostocoides sp. F2B08 TaxID=2653936 RepID=UPI0012635BBA|nr:FKBP-type peptidyl-prolyl cis-trans isomerase [Tetrasphaera sp. F2B08]KAB7742973.1 peptidylprolyl isomerase [Tetrasphaera sp. F2B08]